jgi:Na+/melibiose symporter-like transporter
MLPGEHQNTFRRVLVMDERVKLREKIALGMSDFASCLSRGLAGSFMMYYW